MKTLFIFLIISTLTFTSNGQMISLPSFEEGVYVNDTVYSYYGSLPATGAGSIYFIAPMPADFVTGVDFKMVVDSTNQGLSPSHAAFKDSLGTMVPMYKGDTLVIPASFEVFAGDVGFHLILEGTPTVGDETYLCDLAYMFETGLDWGMILQAASVDTCVVTEVSGVSDHLHSDECKVFPNPFVHSTVIKFNNSAREPHRLVIFDGLGKEVGSKEGILSNQFTVDRGSLVSGVYFYQLSNKNGLKSIGKMIIH